MPSSRSKSRREMVVLPAPLGLDRTKRRPRRSSGLWVAMRATGLRPPAASSRVAPMTRFVALLRAVNVGGRALPMAALRALCEAELGWEGVQTYIQSGNLVFEAKGKADALESALESGIEKQFGFEAPAMIRTAAEWRTLLAANPFPKESQAEPNRVFLGVPSAPRRRAPRSASPPGPPPTSASRPPAPPSGSTTPEAPAPPSSPPPSSTAPRAAP